MSSVSLRVEGDLEAQFNLVWEEVTARMRATRLDMYRTVEQGACCLAMLVIEELTDYKIVQQADRTTGVDYWLGDEIEEQIFSRQAMLEVSGILNGSMGQVNQRVKQKIEQSKKSDNMELPIFIVVVNFNVPIIKITRR